MFDYALAQKAIDKIVETFDPRMVIVFGSVATGTAKDDSDLDILVVMESDMKLAKRASMIYRALAGEYVPMDIIVLTPEEFEEHRDDRYSFTSEIVRTGKVAYEA